MYLFIYFTCYFREREKRRVENRFAFHLKGKGACVMVVLLAWVLGSRNESPDEEALKAEGARGMVGQNGGAFAEDHIPPGWNDAKGSRLEVPRSLYFCAWFLPGERVKRGVLPPFAYPVPSVALRRASGTLSRPLMHLGTSSPPALEELIRVLLSCTSTSPLA